MNYKDLLDFCKNLNEEQLSKEVFLFITDGEAIKIESAVITDKDYYFDHCGALGSLEDIKNEYPDLWDLVVDDSTIQPKGTIYLSNE